MFKNTIRHLLNYLGLEVHRRGGRRVTMKDSLAHLRSTGFTPASVIDVGVGWGTPALYEQFPDARFFLVEPIAEFEPTLQKIARQVRTDYRIAAAGPQAGEITLNVHGDLTSSSTLKEKEGAHVDGTPRTVPMIRLDSLCREAEATGPYLLKVDVQGAELGVLDGAQGILHEVEVIVLEVSLFGFFERGPQFYDVVENMKARGYVVYDIFGGHHRPLDNALAQVDLVFVKENGPLRESHAYSTLDQRASS